MCLLFLWHTPTLARPRRSQNVATTRHCAQPKQIVLKGQQPTTGALPSAKRARVQQRLCVIITTHLYVSPWKPARKCQGFTGVTTLVRLGSAAIFCQSTPHLSEVLKQPLGQEPKEQLFNESLYHINSNPLLVSNISMGFSNLYPIQTSTLGTL